MRKTIKILVIIGFVAFVVIQFLIGEKSEACYKEE
jgi:hypothetical protein